MIKLNVNGYGIVEANETETYEDVVKKIQTENMPTIVAVRCGNILKELTQQISDDCDIHLIDLSYSDGIRIYQRGLSFIMIRAAIECFDGIQVRVEHSLSKGLYCEFDYIRRLNHDDYELIKEKMQGSCPALYRRCGRFSPSRTTTSRPSRRRSSAKGRASSMMYHHKGCGAVNKPRVLPGQCCW